MIPLSPTSMIRSQKFKNFQFLGFFIIWFSSKDLPLFFKFLLENFSLVKWFFGLVFWVGFSGGNFEGANLTRLDSIEIHSGSFFFLSLMMIEEKYYFFIFCILNISRYWRNALYRHPHPKEKGRFYWRLAFSNSCIKI